MNKYLVTISFLALFSACSALKCWVCENAKGEADCRKNGYLKTCSHDEQACQVEIRHHQGFGYSSRLTKRCKQSLACDNNFHQNKKTAWWPTQCNPKFPTNSVCRCCCDTDRCNYKGLKCWDGPSKCTPKHVAPRHGEIHCTNQTFLHSECTFSCKNGYILVGKETSVCQESGVWTSRAPICASKTCPETSPLSHGSVSCTDENRIHSACKYQCNKNYILIGSSSTTCRATGIWSHDMPKCQPLRCHPQREPPMNGSVSCSNESWGGSVCTFTCSYGFVVVGAKSTTCIDDMDGNAVGKWDQVNPMCRPITCRLPQIDPQHGIVTCSNDNLLDSRCEFSCKSGFALVGDESSTCVDDNNGDTNGYWNNPAPGCEPIRCEPRFDNLDNGVVECSQFNFLGSICTFSCDKSHRLVGPGTSVCEKDPKLVGVWSNDQPICVPKKCSEEPRNPVNGYSVCTNDNMYGSQCEFACNEFHRREGALYSTCVEDEFMGMMWDELVPTCVPNVCKHQKLSHGEMKCTNGSEATSTCSFQCTESGYELYPPEIDTNTCLNTTNWDRPQPCCARQCPPYALMDFVIILDSSSSISLPNWHKMIEFVKGFVDDFAVADDATYFGIFRYNKHVDQETQIMLNKNVNIEQILEDISKMPYDGSGTYTGNALDHALNVILTKENGNRHDVNDVVLVITDGKSQDDVSKPAKRLRDSGAKVFALPIQPPRGALDMEQVLAITGDEKQVIKDASEVGFAALTAEFSQKLGKEICGDPCVHKRHDHD